MNSLPVLTDYLKMTEGELEDAFSVLRVAQLRRETDQCELLLRNSIIVKRLAIVRRCEQIAQIEAEVQAIRMHGYIPQGTRRRITQIERQIQDIQRQINELVDEGGPA